MAGIGDVRAYAKSLRNAYWRAHVVEYTSDRFWSEKIYSRARIVPLRPTVFSESFRSSRRLLWLTRAACLAWPLLFPLLMISRYAAFRRKWSAETGKGQAAAKLDRVVLCLSPIIMRSLARVSHAEQIPQDYITIPRWERLLGPAPKGSQVHHMLGLLDRHDLWDALRVSLKLGPTLWRRRGAPYSLRLQSYDTYEWVLVAIYLAKTNPREIWLTNQRDRWVSLVDDHFAKRARSGSTGDKLVIVQHGLTLAEQPRIPKYKWVTDFWYFDAVSRANCASNTVAHPDRIRWHEALGLLPTGDVLGDGFSVLFVSHRMYSARMRNIVQLASSGLQDATLYYKQHPLHPEAPFQARGLQFIQDTDQFPMVDAVVSYNSALAVEYRQLGVPVIFIEENDDTSVLESLAALETAKRANQRPGETLASPGESSP